MEVGDLPDGRLHDKPRAGQGRLPGALPRLKRPDRTTGEGRVNRPRPSSGLSKEEPVGSILRKVLILVAPFAWRKFKERRRSRGR